MSNAVQVRQLEADDREGLLKMRRALWPDSTTDELDELLVRLETADDTCVFVADAGNGSLAGFAEIGVRPFGEGCSTSPVAYLEGIYVCQSHRRLGVATALVVAARVWANERGLAELASDADVANLDSRAFHQAAGFSEVGQTVNFVASTRIANQRQR